MGADDPAHPAVSYLRNKVKEFYVGGSVQAIQAPKHFDYVGLRCECKPGTDMSVADARHPHRAPSVLPQGRMAQGRRFPDPKPDAPSAPRVDGPSRPTTPRQCPHPPCRRSHQARRRRPLHPGAGLPGPHALLPGGHGPPRPLAPCHANGWTPRGRLARHHPKELWCHALCKSKPRKRPNKTCSRQIVGRDHAGPGKNSQGKDFYGPYDAQELVTQFKDELQIEMVPFQAMTYLPGTDEYQPVDEVPKGTPTADISGTELRKRLRTGASIPDWFSYTGVVKVLRESYPPRPQQGFTGESSINVAVTTDADSQSC